MCRVTSSSAVVDGAYWWWWWTTTDRIAVQLQHTTRDCCKGAVCVRREEEGSSTEYFISNLTRNSMLLCSSVLFPCRTPQVDWEERMLPIDWSTTPLTVRPSSLFSSINYYLYRVGPVFRWLNNIVLCWCTFTTSSLVCWWWVLLFTVYLKTLSMDGRVHIHFYSRLIWGASGNKWFYTCVLVVRVVS